MQNKNNNSGKKNASKRNADKKSVQNVQKKPQSEKNPKAKHTSKRNSVSKKNQFPAAEEPVVIKNDSSKSKKKKGSVNERKKRGQTGPSRGFGSAVRIAFLGGINEIGKNLTVFEYNDDMIIVDCGMTFPDADMPGIDYVLPDISYVERNADKVRAVFITHGHEDHIGALPYFLKSINVPVYSSALTAGLIKGKLKEHRILGQCSLKVIKPGDVISAGAFSVEAIHVNHSIPDSLAFAIRCGAGTIVHTGDFKIDNTPIDGGVMDLARLATIGSEGVLCLMSDSTNAERAGYTPSEKNVGETLEQLFNKAAGKRIIVASFASNIHRIQQIITSSQKTGRKVFLSGRSLENVVAVSIELGYLNVPDGIMKNIDALKNYRDEETVIITTGSQGEPMSALSRMASNDHRKVSIGRNDFVIISATPIPGNEKTVANTINDLMRLGAEVVYEKNLGIHVSGHAAQEEQKLILNLVRPKYFIPVHGEQKHLRKHAALAQSVGIAQQNILVPELGSVIEASDEHIGFTGSVESGRIFIDSSGVGDVGNTILRDRKKLSTDGIVIITAVTDAYTGEVLVPVCVETRGFVFMNDSGGFISSINDICADILERNRSAEVSVKKNRIKETASKVIFDKTRRSPIIIVSVLAV